MAQKPFGSILAEARERQGIDIDYAAQQLRIRADILHAIEHNDFARMPARGYTRNMVNAYARLLGLNAPSLTRQYLDEANAYQISSRYHDEDRSLRSSRGSRQRDAYNDRPRSARSSRDDYRRGGSRDTYSDRPDRSTRSGGRGVSYQTQPRNIRNTRTGRQRGYSQNYGNQGNPLLERLPYIIGAIVIVLLLVFIISQIVSCATPKQTATTSVPITGVSDTTGGDESSTNTNKNATSVVESAPTSVAVSYTIKDGYSTYMEIYENSDTVTNAEVVTGPTTGAFTVTSKLTIKVVNPDAITLTVDGKEVELTLEDSTSMYAYTVDFAQILNDWAQTHKSNTANTSTNKNTNNTTNSNANSNSASA